MTLELEEAHLPTAIARETLAGLVQALVHVWATGLL